MTISQIFLENGRRLRRRRTLTADPASAAPPREMFADPDYSPGLDAVALDKLRFRHDFEYWCLKCVKISDKVTRRLIPFRLNAPQRRLAALLEQRRREGRPLRFIMLKARQWGGSTLVQIYFAWIQIIHRHNWNSLICAHVKDTSSTILAMYERLLANYPPEYWEETDDDGKPVPPSLRACGRMSNTRQIPGRGCRITVCSSESQEAVRGQDCAMAHLTEVAFWRDSPRHDPLDLIRSVSSGILLEPYTAVVLESTANGVGNYFHREWLRAVAGKSDKTPFFVPWYEIEFYSEPVDDGEALWNSLDDYERSLWFDHPDITLEAIAWYHRRRLEYEDQRAMKAEFPSTPEEAFTNTGFNVFASPAVGELRRECRVARFFGEVEGSPSGLHTDISSPRFVECPDGRTEIWQPPESGAAYTAAVDIGGRSASSDWSVIAVIRTSGERPEVVAQWRGHIDHDLLGWKAAAMAAWYNRATLIFESNTLESEGDGTGKYLLDTLSAEYPALYRRCEPGMTPRPGFHTNRATKSAMIANLIRCVREGLYVERSHDACDELLTYELLPSGVYAARKGCHDDILMTRAIALYVIASSDPRTPLISQADVSPLWQ